MDVMKAFQGLCRDYSINPDTVNKQSAQNKRGCVRENATSSSFLKGDQRTYRAFNSAMPAIQIRIVAGCGTDIAK
jgi:hypothetical protein